MHVGQEGGPQEGPAALNLELGPHTRVSPNSGPPEPESPRICSLSSHRPRLRVRRHGCWFGT